MEASVGNSHCKKVLGLISRWFDPGPYCVEFVCSLRVYASFLWELRFPPTVQKKEEKHAARFIIVTEF